MIIWFFVIALILFIASMCISGARAEDKEWNNGMCSKCNSVWRYFDTSSQGCRGFTCTGDNCENTTWQTWRKRWGHNK